jgi:hypothetical protein
MCSIRFERNKSGTGGLFPNSQGYCQGLHGQ